MHTIPTSHAPAFVESAKGAPFAAALRAFAARCVVSLWRRHGSRPLPRDARLLRDIGLLPEEEPTERNIALYMDVFGHHGLNTAQAVDRVRRASERRAP